VTPVVAVLVAVLTFANPPTTTTTTSTTSSVPSTTTVTLAPPTSIVNTPPTVLPTTVAPSTTTTAPCPPERPVRVEDGSCVGVDFGGPTSRLAPTGASGQVLASFGVALVGGGVLALVIRRKGRNHKENP
jgi:hypothetical protein